jgi:hypothetical protein
LASRNEVKGAYLPRSASSTWLGAKLVDRGLCDLRIRDWDIATAARSPILR